MSGAMEKEASHLERQHVHNVYEKIAPYFNDKRYKAWPKVQEFLLAQEPGSLVADIGCGNGKYLHINNQAFNIGCDYCVPLAEAAGKRGYEVLVGNGLHLPYRDNCFDAVISIAVIHHFSTNKRRVQAIKEMTRILRVGGQMMIYVWAMEQKRRKFEKQDLLIPWNREPIRPNLLQKKDLMHRDYNPLSSYDRRVHHSMLANNIPKTPADLCSSIGLASRLLAQTVDLEFDGKSKYGSCDPKHECIICRLYGCCTELRKSTKTYTSGVPKPAQLLKQLGDLLPKYKQTLGNNANKVTDFFTSLFANKSHHRSSNAELGREMIKNLRKVLFPDTCSSSTRLVDRKDCTNSASDHDKDLHIPENSSGLRYYHIFKQGELNNLIEQCCPGLHIVRTFYDHSNWCVIAEKV